MPLVFFYRHTHLLDLFRIISCLKKLDPGNTKFGGEPPMGDTIFSGSKLSREIALKRGPADTPQNDKRVKRDISVARNK
jgi:hypothetical protein